MRVERHAGQQTAQLGGPSIDLVGNRGRRCEGRGHTETAHAVADAEHCRAAIAHRGLVPLAQSGRISGRRLASRKHAQPGRRTGKCGVGEDRIKRFGGLDAEVAGCFGDHLGVGVGDPATTELGLGAPQAIAQIEAHGEVVGRCAFGAAQRQR